MSAAAAKSSWFTLGIICVGVACLFASQNIMSPNLTSMAEVRLASQTIDN